MFNLFGWFDLERVGTRRVSWSRVMSLVRCALLICVSEFCRVRGHYEQDEFSEVVSGIHVPKKQSDLRTYLESGLLKMVDSLGPNGVKGVKMFDRECLVELNVSFRMTLLVSCKSGSKPPVKESPFEWVRHASKETQAELAKFLQLWRVHVSGKSQKNMTDQLSFEEQVDLEESDWDLRVISWGDEMNHSKKLAKMNQLGTIVKEEFHDFSIIQDPPETNERDLVDDFDEGQLTDHESGLTIFFQSVL